MRIYTIKESVCYKQLHWGRLESGGWTWLVEDGRFTPPGFEVGGAWELPGMVGCVWVLPIFADCVCELLTLVGCAWELPTPVGCACELLTPVGCVSELPALEGVWTLPAD